MHMAVQDEVYMGENVRIRKCMCIHMNNELDIIHVNNELDEYGRYFKASPAKWKSL